MVVKARKQGNSLMVTIPKAFNIAEGASFTPHLQEDGIFFERVDTAPRFVDDFDALLLTDIIKDGYTDGEAIIKEMEHRKSLMEDRLAELMDEPSSQMTEEDFNREFGL
ncbi:MULTISPECIES: AbrB/MazE/SpoVT family DNA-binding domain-containing protein [Aerococcus]|uniref:AbrB/MazE/SpoVT family DNA-binding domain-containing protein n=2 Tax=Aerococcus TaxID=1375 RepID=A0ABT4C3L8_9LACT|nr:MULTISPECIES: AbrB/MazE/SpoVT family DNA-binding domain-containing protein [Aerococcus]AMB95558.1 hypothetical protein AWM73_03010 [Aerococcus urinae]KAA9242804.1 AbrB/MazE/SpoVT family DNA-binding domain-containing protein [Aerococcus urinae]MCY3032578.1 AbrB/MazE/SpoVT family DNA-binding domain-containing protein [Aerococcus urinae]MCY3037879.1 AbrB/MazE/SpoVT family DNA-binding domain-containing protein [Aerococcus urinae]MCY3044624.1 AbrB/MazE/SpoVT family DNA-binding domain-containing 